MKFTIYDGKKVNAVFTSENGKGTIETYYSNGQLKERCAYRDPQEGESPSVHTSHDQFGLTTFQTGPLDGPYMSYYPNGMVRKRCAYKDGKLEGECDEFSETGELVKTSFYHNGEIIKDVKKQMEIRKKQFSEDPMRAMVTYAEMKRYQDMDKNSGHQ